MRYHALATDYDGTLARDEHVSEEIIESLRQFKQSGRKLILVSGRELEDLKRVFNHLDIFDIVVLENGALLYYPQTLEEKTVAESPSQAFVNRLKERGVAPLSVGRVIVATWEPQDKIVLEVIKELGLELQIIYNKGAVMVLPSGINKARGLKAALKELGLSFHNVVAIGDAENDHAFLEASECAVAVSNALDSIKERADIVTIADHGYGVVELANKIIQDDLRDIITKSENKIMLGHDAEGNEVNIRPYGTNILTAGTSGGGKSTFTTAFLDALVETKYQFCLIDPEGDYKTLENAIILGDTENPPVIDEIIKFMETSEQNVVVCTLAISFDDKPEFFQKIFTCLLELRARTGRPHWMIFDEFHHFFPASWSKAVFNIPKELHNLFMITTKPELINSAILEQVNMVVAFGENPGETINSFAGIEGFNIPEIPDMKLERGEALVWEKQESTHPFWMRCRVSQNDRLRHARKYSVGELMPDRVFYFKGPEGKLNLKVQNLMMFMQMADGVDDETWNYHLKRKEYSEWFKLAIKDDVLVDEASAIEDDSNLSVQESKDRIRKIIERRYTGPA